MLFNLRIVAPVPASRPDVGFGKWRDVDFRLEPVQDRSHAERLPGNDGRSRSIAGLSLANHFDGQINAAAKIRGKQTVRWAVPCRRGLLGSKDPAGRFFVRR